MIACERKGRGEAEMVYTPSKFLNFEGKNGVITVCHSDYPHQSSKI
jgi:hypothetical protein